jgi:hypothetical protein
MGCVCHLLVCLNYDDVGESDENKDIVKKNNNTISDDGKEDNKEVKTTVCVNRMQNKSQYQYS